MDTAVLVPKKGLIVRDPISGNALPPEGMQKQLSTYWLRRMADGDVTKQTKTTRTRPAREEE